VAHEFSAGDRIQFTAPHKALGVANRDLVNADTGFHPDMLNSRFGYVSIFRASHEVTVFINDARILGQRLGTEVINKLCARCQSISKCGTGNWN
jgi:hypothetical protein